MELLPLERRQLPFIRPRKAERALNAHAKRESFSRDLRNPDEARLQAAYGEETILSPRMLHHLKKGTSSVANGSLY